MWEDKKPTETQASKPTPEPRVWKGMMGISVTLPELAEELARYDQALIKAGITDWDLRKQLIDKASWAIWDIILQTG